MTSYQQQPQTSPQHRFLVTVFFSVGFCFLLLFVFLTSPKFQECLSASSSNKKNSVIADNNNYNNKKNNVLSFPLPLSPKQRKDSDELDIMYKSVLKNQKELFEEDFTFLHGGENEQEAAENEREQHEQEASFYTPSGKLANVPELSETETIPKYPFSSLVYPDDKTLFNSIRQKNGRFLQPLPDSCNLPWGNSTSCSNQQQQVKSSGSLPSCCCCCWIPIQSSCAGNFDLMNPATFKWKLGEKVNFISKKLPSDILLSVTAATITKQQQQLERDNILRTSCPWFDYGTWAKPLPDNFVELSEEQVDELPSCASSCPGRKSSSISGDKKKKNKKIENKKKIGLQFLHELAETTLKLRPQNKPSSPPSTTFNMTEFLPLMTVEQKQHLLSRSTTSNAPGGIFLIAGDSITRNMFTRIIHRIRSRECSGEAEFRRRAVFEIQSHDTMAYVATTHGDGMVLTRNCEAGIDFLSNYGVAPGKVLFQMCFIWDNTQTALHATVANLNQLQSRVASLIFFPQIWYCAFRLKKEKVRLCQTANQSAGAVLTVIGTAMHQSIPRVVVTTSVIRQKFPYYQLSRIQERNKRLKEMFPLQPFGNEYLWVRGMNFSDSIRLYDFASRHDVLWPEACDNLHSMCMFLPNRERYEVMLDIVKKINFEKMMLKNILNMNINNSNNNNNNKKNRNVTKVDDRIRIFSTENDNNNKQRRLSFSDYNIQRIFGGGKCPSPATVASGGDGGGAGGGGGHSNKKKSKFAHHNYFGNGLCQDMSDVILFDEIMTALRL